MKGVRFSVLLALMLSCASLTGVAFGAPKAEVAKPVAAEAVSQATAAVPGQVSTINLNTADADTLQKELKGIGKVKAEAIVKYRDEHGPFASVDQLLEVKGIGKKLLERNADKLTIQ
ncbi:ComEA family DNA-binding protein [Pseudomonas schmalbachii]|uniref:Helix-hairpin-helix domain-containing protein n=1 Tax=Pseudomonas schmalbachii TaxID=2816993 RepID=A0ABS3TLM9_9PSED|nr:helix-hairpin-helix domain-containing protein [Pseudomonas schmalbachii]MBO3274572.1 helix-hairpin-helix domain-containing protein [Pseudomonas schmalbachii]